MKILTKKQVFRRILCVAVGFVALFTVAFQAIKSINNNQVDAATEDGANVNVQPYDPVEYGTWATNHFAITSGSEQFLGFCAEPNKPAPAGLVAADKITNDSLIYKQIKLIIYAYNVKANPNFPTQPGSAVSAVNTILNNIFPPNMDDRSMFAYTHGIIGYIYSGSTAGLAEDQILWVQAASLRLAQIIDPVNYPAETPGVQEFVTASTPAWTEASRAQLYGLDNASTGNQNVMWIEPSPVGKITVNKIDADTGSCTNTGSLSFQGTVFTLINNTGGSIVYGGNTIANGGTVATKTMAAGDCSVTFTDLPYGTYTVKESTAATGYTADSDKNVTLSSASASTTFTNTPKKGKVTVNKTDKDTGSCTTTGDLSFNGTTFTLTNNSANPIVYNGNTVAVNAVIDTKSLSNGACSVTFENLPYGNYIVKESRASTGYVRNTGSFNVTIPTNNSVNVSTTVSDQAIRGDVKFVKMDSNNDEPMRNTVFSISAVDEDNNVKETHIVVSNDNGVVDTSSSFNLHSNNTNGYDAIYDSVDPVVYAGYGTWFGINHEGNPIPVNDNVGALPYGKYIIQELKCGANLFCTGTLNQKKTITINTANQVIDLGDWNNACTKFSVDTEAVDEKDGDRYVEAGKEVKIKDKIEYCVTPGLDFVIKGILMDKETGEPLLINDETVEESIDLRVDEECGETEMIFTLDASELAGKEVVVFESIYFRDDLITSHEDIDDDAQTVMIISLTTTATNKEDGGKVLPVDRDVEIVDLVKYCLEPGVEYTLTGVLMNKETKESVKYNNEPVEQTYTFTPEETCGEFEMTYKFNSTGLGGVGLVVFESLYIDDELVLEHNDYNNADESVDVELPAPDTGLFTKDSGASSKESTDFTFVVVGGLALIAVGGYAYTRYTSRKKFFNH